MNQQDSIGLEPPFDHLTALLCGQFGLPFGLISVVDGERSVFRWQTGLGEGSLPRERSISSILVEMGPGAHLVVEDALLHPVLKDHPMVVGPPHLRFFAGATISNGQGQAIGAVGVMDTAPRSAPTPAEFATLDHVAAIAGSMLDQVATRRLQAERLKLLGLAEQMSGVGHWRYDLLSGEVTWSDEVYRIHGYVPGAINPGYGDVLASYHPEDAPILARAVEAAIATGEGYELQLRLRTPDLEERLVITQAATVQDLDGRTVSMFGVFQDVTATVGAQARLERSEALFRMMSETATDIIARYGPDGTLLYLSPSVEAIMGRTPADLVGRKCTDFIYPEDLGKVCPVISDYLAAGPGAKSPRIEYRASRPDGSVVWLEASPRAVRDPDGRVVEIHDHVRDITARKETERAQAELVGILGMAEELGGVGCWRLDVASGAVTWSDEVYRIHGKSRETFDPSFDDAVGCYHPDDRQTVADCCLRAIETGEGGGFQLRLIREDGEERIVTAHCRPERDATGKVSALFGVFQDVTDQVRVQQRIEASEARYRLLADNATDIIATYGLDGVFRYLSPAIEGAMGFRPDELVGRPFADFMHPDDVTRVQAAFLAYAKAGPGAASPRVAYRAVRKDGGFVWLEAHPKVLRDAAGRAIEFQDVVRDVSDTKRLEDQLIDARDRAEAGARTQSEFLANMSHELRTPLTSVIGFSGLLRASANLPDAERRYADRIATSSEALLSVINDILDYSKLEAEAVALEPQPFDPVAMAQGAAMILEAQCLQKGLIMAVEAADDLPQALTGDEGRLRQVTLNFLSNAVKFTAQGEIRLVLSMTGGWLRVAVTDQGIGIAADKIDRLFDRFTQGDASTTRVYGGTGLGLAISHRLIGMMGGRIGVESQPGEGSTFWFEVPLEIADGEARAACSPDAAIAGSTRILMADDAPANRELVTALFSGLGLELDTVCDGVEAVEAARSGVYDLILMDVHMPSMDGLAATRAIRGLSGPEATTPIIALTANVQPEQIERCLAAGMDAHVGKPIQVSELLNAIAKGLAMQRSQPAGDVVAA